MPRRNRNAHAISLDADGLAAQASQLTAELGTFNGVTVYLVDEIQLYIASARHRTGKSSILRDYLTRWTSEHPLGQITVADAKAATSHGRD